MTLKQIRGVEMKTKWLLMILAVVMIWLISSISQGADKFYFGSYGGKEHAYMLKDSLRFNIIQCLMEPSDIDFIANGSLRAIVHPATGEDHPTHWAWNSHYTLWEAEGFPESYVNLQYVSWGALVNAMKFSGPGTPGLIQTGPSYYQEGSLWGNAIEYTAEFRLKFHYNLYTPPGPPTPVCSLKVADRGTILKDTVLYKSDFPGSGNGGYKTFKLIDYTVPDDWNNRIEFKIYWFAIPEAVNFYIDYVKVYDDNGQELIDQRLHNQQIIAYVSQDWVTTPIQGTGEPAVYRWYGRDEPPSIDLYMPHVYIDSLLKEVNQERVLFQAFWRFENPDEAHEYLLRQNPKDICFDIFPMDDFGHSTTGSTYQQNWSKQIGYVNFAKTEAESLGKDFWLVPQAWTWAKPYTGDCDYYPLIYWDHTWWCPQQRDPSAYELRLQTFLGLCYGADGILYFNYEWWIDGYGNLLTGLYDLLPGDSSTYKWREIRDFTGPRAEKLGSILIHLNWLGACVDSSNDRFDLLGCGDGYLDSIRSHNSVDEPHWVQVGFFENATADTSYFMLVNRECLETEGANYDVFVTKTDGPYQIRDMYTDSVVDYVNGTGDYFTIYLGPGEGKLLRLERYIRGDVNGDGVINVADVVYLINYLFIDGPAPQPLAAGDANCNEVVDIVDVVYLINYLFIDGPPPCEPPRDSGR
jgi:hypothetical protein